MFPVFWLAFRFMSTLLQTCPLIASMETSACWCHGIVLEALPKALPRQFKAGRLCREAGGESREEGQGSFPLLLAALGKAYVRIA